MNIKNVNYSDKPTVNYNMLAYDPIDFRPLFLTYTIKIKLKGGGLNF